MRTFTENLMSIMDMSIKVGGLKLRNPFIVSSCSLTANPENNLEFEKAGAGAIVLKSIFQEEILAEMASYDSSVHPEAYDYLGAYTQESWFSEYCKLISDTKRLCTIPVIASINCSNADGWASFAKRFVDAGADAIEINVMRIEGGADYSYGELEKQHIAILKAVKAAVSVPVIVKVGQNFTNVVPLVHELYKEGAAAVVLFNKMCPVDIDVDTLSFKMGNVISSASELPNVLRWTALASASLPAMPIIASGGVIDGPAMAKAILSGAYAVEVCSALYAKGAPVIGEMLAYLDSWMKEHHFASIEHFKASMNASHHEGSTNFERIQFFKNITKKD